MDLKFARFLSISKGTFSERLPIFRTKASREGYFCGLLDYDKSFLLSTLSALIWSFCMF